MNRYISLVSSFTYNFTILRHRRCIATSSIKRLTSPKEYFFTLKTLISASKDRIVLSALYVGSEHFEQDLLQTINDALSDNSRSNLSVTIILDHSRATRKNSSVAFLSPLVHKYFPRFQIWLYQMPILRFMKWPMSHILPNVVKETMAVYHVKYCLVDDVVILSGANLSKEYFSSRQDRYFVFRSDGHQTPLVRFLEDFSSVLGEHCHQVRSDGTIDPPKNRDHASLADALHRLSQNTCILDRSRTLMAPLIQHKSIFVDQCDRDISRLFNHKQATFVVSSPYPSFQENFIKNLVENCKKVVFIVPSLSAHGFSQGRGVKALIPKLHEESFRQAMNICLAHMNPSDLELRRYDKDGWTYHAKGIWMKSDDGSTATYIGSSNLGQRSSLRDFELGFILSTDDQSVKEILDSEVRDLTSHSQLDSVNLIDNNNDRTNVFIRGIAYIFKSYL